ncbi:uncharacterized protein LOC121297485 [Polyodon spathula]|uniref:uncharacterized protein LOC121297485 n=1 Tax=Polyodon spathula TaxID=7913 RepID=UPI001B7F5DD3|nr:uncharacterized protein LOC121297485 [Polyodon spathula]
MACENINSPGAGTSSLVSSHRQGTESLPLVHHTALPLTVVRGEQGGTGFQTGLVIWAGPSLQGSPERTINQTQTSGGRREAGLQGGGDQAQFAAVGLYFKQAVWERSAEECALIAEGRDTGNNKTRSGHFLSVHWDSTRSAALRGAQDLSVMRSTRSAALRGAQDLSVTGSTRSAALRGAQDLSVTGSTRSAVLRGAQDLSVMGSTRSTALRRGRISLSWDSTHSAVLKGGQDLSVRGSTCNAALRGGRISLSWDCCLGQTV